MADAFHHTYTGDNNKIENLVNVYYYRLLI